MPRSVNVSNHSRNGPYDNKRPAFTFVIRQFLHTSCTIHDQRGRPCYSNRRNAFSLRQSRIGGSRIHLTRRPFAGTNGWRSAWICPKKSKTAPYPFGAWTGETQPSCCGARKPPRKLYVIAPS